jgi:hypothetical protein
MKPKTQSLHSDRLGTLRHFHGRNSEPSSGTTMKLHTKVQRCVAGRMESVHNAAWVWFSFGGGGDTFQHSLEAFGAIKFATENRRK